MNGRRGTVVWISAPDEGDAAAAAAEIGAWLAQRPQGRDWEGVLGPLRDALQRLSLHPLIRQDAVSRDILGQLAPNPTIDQVASVVTALARRVDALTDVHDGARSRLRLGL